MRKLLPVLLISLLVLMLSVTTVAVSYRDAQENPDLRSEYVRLLTQKHPPPIGLEIKYTGENHEKATMAISYPLSDDPLEKEDLKFSIYSEAFDYEVEDDFISTIYHEYNHIRALTRAHVLEDNNFYMEIKPEMIFLNGFEEAWNNPITNLSWEDIHKIENYNSGFVAQVKKSRVAKLAIHTFIAANIFEMLAIEEEIYRHQNGLNPSEDFRKSRYELYFNHYRQMMRFLNSLEACQSLTDKLNRIFYRSWFRKKIDSYQFVKIVYGLNP